MKVVCQQWDVRQWGGEKDMKITIKSIVTILLTIVFCLLSLAGRITSEQYMTVFTTVIAFYFGTQFSKNGKGN